MIMQIFNKLFEPMENSEEYFLKLLNVKLLFLERPPKNINFYIYFDSMHA